MESTFLLLITVTKFCWSIWAMHLYSIYTSNLYIYVVWYPIVSSILSATMAIKKKGNNGKIGSISILNFEPLRIQFFFFFYAESLNHKTYTYIKWICTGRVQKLADHCQMPTLQHYMDVSLLVLHLVSFLRSAISTTPQPVL